MTPAGPETVPNFHAPLYHRFVVLAGLGGFVAALAFYEGVVLPIAHDVLGGQRPVGFITRHVALALNLLGGVAVLVGAWDLRCRRRGRWSWLVLGVMALAQVGLALLYPVLDGMLIPATREIVDAELFYGRHRIYLLGSAVVWIGSSWLLCTALATWRRVDRAAARSEVR